MKKPRLGYITQFAAVSLMFAVISLIIGIIPAKNDKYYLTSAESGEKAPVIVIDPGHGGEDGGASSEDGLLEKDLNLEVSRLCSVLLELGGCDVRMTRSTDTLLYDLYGDRENYKGYKKTYDLKNRLRFASEAEADAFVSIHMNKFCQKQYNGLQVYYSPNCDSSKQLAEGIKNSVRLNLQPENERETKKATSSIYLLKNIKIPAVLVECGFLSNYEEAQKLSTAEYRRDLSSVIAASVCEWAYSKG